MIHAATQFLLETHSKIYQYVFLLFLFNYDLAISQLTRKLCSQIKALMHSEIVQNLNDYSLSGHHMWVSNDTTPLNANCAWISVTAQCHLQVTVREYQWRHSVNYWSLRVNTKDVTVSITGHCAGISMISLCQLLVTVREYQWCHSVNYWSPRVNITCGHWVWKSVKTNYIYTPRLSHINK